MGGGSDDGKIGRSEGWKIPGWDSWASVGSPCEDGETSHDIGHTARDHAEVFPEDEHMVARFRAGSFRSALFFPEGILAVIEIVM